MDPSRQQHLRGDEGEDDAEAVVEQAEAVEHSREGEEEGAEPEDCEDVRGVGDEGVAGDGQHGRNRVQREDQVGALDGEHDQHEGKGGERDGLARGFRWSDHRGFRGTGVLLRLRQRLTLDPSHDPGGFAFGGLMAQEADCGDQQDDSKHILDPGEVGEQGDAGGDEESAHDDGPADSPEQDAVLLMAVEAEGAEEDKEDEKVVDAQRALDQIARKELKGVLMAVGAQQPEREGGGQQSEEDRPAPGHAPGDFLVLVAEEEEIDREQDDDENMEGDPIAEGRAGDHLSMLLDSDRSAAGTTPPPPL